jgi:hypothetical protein
MAVAGVVESAIRPWKQKQMPPLTWCERVNFVVGRLGGKLHACDIFSSLPEWISCFYSLSLFEEFSIQYGRTCVIIN